MNRLHKSYLFSFITLLSFNSFGVNPLNFNKVLAEESIRDQYNSYEKRSINNAQFSGVGDYKGHYIFVDDGGRIYSTKYGNNWDKFEKIRYGYITTYYEKTDECQTLDALALFGGNLGSACFETHEVKRETVFEDNKLVIYVKKGERSPERFVLGIWR